MDTNVDYRIREEAQRTLLSYIAWYITMFPGLPRDIINNVIRDALLFFSIERPIELYKPIAKQKAIRVLKRIAYHNYINTHQLSEQQRLDLEEAIFEEISVSNQNQLPIIPGFVWVNYRRRFAYVDDSDESVANNAVIYYELYVLQPVSESLEPLNNPDPLLIQQIRNYLF